MLVRKEKGNLWKVDYMGKVRWLMRSFWEKGDTKEGDLFSSQEQLGNAKTLLIWRSVGKKENVSVAGMCKSAMK